MIIILIIKLIYKLINLLIYNKDQVDNISICSESKIYEVAIFNNGNRPLIEYRWSLISATPT